MRASRILSTRPERAIYAIAQLCEERMEALIPATSPTAAFVPPRLSPLPPQTPYTVGSSPMRQTKIDVPEPKNVSEVPSIQSPSEVSSVPVPSTSTPDHMAPKRSKWTSPPPPYASAEDRSQFEGQLDLGLALATLPTDARQLNAGYASSSNSEILTDDGDDLQSIHSLSLSEAPERSRDRRDAVSESLPSLSPLSCSPQASPYSAPVYSPQLPIPEGILVPTKLSHVPPREPYHPPASPNALLGRRGRPRHLELIQTSPRLNSPRRSHSGPPGPSSVGLNGKPFPLLTMAVMTPLPPSPSPTPPQPYVFYESAPSPAMVYPVSPRYPPRFHAAAIAAASVAARARMAPSPTATPTAPSHFQIHHAHSHSMTTVHARTPSPRTGAFAHRSRGDRAQSTGSASPSPPDSLSAGSDSPAPSSLSSQCDAGADLVRWEQGDEGEEEEGTPEVNADADGGAWRGVEGKVPSDVLSHPFAEPGGETVPRHMCGTPSP